jgi:hypothetical protein
VGSVSLSPTSLAIRAWLQTPSDADIHKRGVKVKDPLLVYICLDDKQRFLGIHRQYSESRLEFSERFKDIRTEWIYLHENDNSCIVYASNERVGMILERQV